MEQKDKDYFNTVLIIDDDLVNRKILAKIFSKGYRTIEAPNGSKGLSEILTNRKSICAILLDVVMPGMSGIEVLRHLERMNILEEIPVFLITAEDEAETEREAYRIGAMDLIMKPVVPYMVRRRIESVIELFAARKRLHDVVQTQYSELTKQANRIMQLNRGMIETLISAIEFRSAESRGHINRILAITKFVLENTNFVEGLTQDDIDNISFASIMHDVGEIAIPDDILTKPGRVTPEEYEILKTHTTKGVTLLESIPQLRESKIYQYACDIVLHHHERWDGSGYPDHLVGDEISLWAQLVSLADVYDTLRTPCIYREAFTRKKTLEFIWSGECGAFNPHLLDCFFMVEEQIDEIYQVEEENEKEENLNLYSFCL